MVQTSTPGPAPIDRRRFMALSAIAGLSACASATTTDTTEPAAPGATAPPAPVATTAPVTTASATTVKPAAVTVPEVDVIEYTTRYGEIVEPRPKNPGPPPTAPDDAIPFDLDIDGWTLRGYEVPGPEPTVVALHGFPDNLHLYDELVDALRGRRRVVVFDFIGWGTSDKPLPGTFEYTMAANRQQVATVIDHVATGPVDLIVHDASGPSGIDFALERPEAVRRLIILNSFYGLAPNQSPPTAININADPQLHDIERAIRTSPKAFEALYRWQVGAVFLGANPNREAVVDRLWSQFPEATPAFTALTDTLFEEVRQRTVENRLDQLAMPVDIMFGGLDGNLSPAVAQFFNERIPNSTIAIIDGAGHFVQIDAPDQVAELIMSR